MYYATRPVYWVQDMLGAEPDEWQGEALEALAAGKKVAVRSGHGVGKTATESWAVLWFLATRPYPRVPCTAPTEHQLSDVLWSEMAMWLERSKAKDTLVWSAEKVYMVGRKKTWFAVARTASKPENLAGFHNRHMLFVIDEASGMKDTTMAVVDGALTEEGALALMCGNPTKATGYFADAFGRHRWAWHTMVVSCERSSRVSKQWIEEMARKWGRDSDVFRVRVMGLPPKTEADVFIPVDWAEMATQSDVEPGGLLELGVDVGRYGNSETVITARWGNFVFPQHIYRRKGVDETAGNVLKWAREYMALTKIPAIAIKVDDSGVGGGVTDLLEAAARDDRRITVVPCNFGGPGDEHYKNATGVMWGKIRELMRYETVAPWEGAELKACDIRIPNDNELIGQLCSRKYEMTEKGKVRLETKEEMTERGLPSPDRADSLVLAFYQPGGMPMDAELQRLLQGASLTR
jgi:hypothetical protein